MSAVNLKLILYPGLLKLAGFVLIVGLGYASDLAALLGVVLFGLGAATVYFKTDADNLERAGMFSIILLAINLAFFSTHELLPLADVSLLVYALILFDLAVLAIFKIRKQPSAFKLPYKWPVAFFLISIIASVVFATSAKDVVYYFVICTFAFLLFYFSFILLEKKDSIHRLLKSFLFISFASSLIALWQLYSQSFKAFYYPFIASRDQEILELWEVVSRVVGTWQHPSYLGIMLALSIPIGLYLLFYEAKSKAWKTTLAVFLVVISSVLLLTNTRSSVISAFIGVVAFFWLGRKSRGRILPSPSEFAVIGLIAAGALLLYQFVFVAEIYTKPQAWRVDASATIWGRFLRSDRMSTESLVQRSQLYTLAWDEFKANPIVGIGGKNFPFKVEGLFERGTDAHNIFLQTLAETGIIGFFALLWLYSMLLKDVFYKQASGQDQKLHAALASVLTVILFDSLFNNPLYSLRILSIFWLIVGLLKAYEQAPNQPARLES